MHRLRHIARGLTLALVLCSGVVSAQLPDAGVAYSGLILGPSGAPVTDATAEIDISLWSAPTGGTAYCSMAAAQVPLTAGRFSLLLGPTCTQALVNNSDVFVQVSVNRVQLNRTPVTAVAAAARAASAAFSLRSERLTGLWQNVPLQTGWQGYTRCRRLGDTVVVALYAYNTSATFSGAATQVVGTLPADCRPAITSPDPVASVAFGPGGGVPGAWAGFAFVLAATGQVVVTCSNAGDSTTFCSGANQKSVSGTIVFPAD